MPTTSFDSVDVHRGSKPALQRGRGPRFASARAVRCDRCEHRAARYGLQGEQYCDIPLFFPAAARSGEFSWTRWNGEVTRDACSTGPAGVSPPYLNLGMTRSVISRIDSRTCSWVRPP